MQPLLLHYCETCTSNTPVPFTASVFSQNHSCSHCGALSVGVNVRAKSEEQKERATMQKENMQQEELAQLFSANMTLTQHLRPTPPRPEQPAYAEQPAQPQQQDQKQTGPASPITYASQHYTHSYHVVPVHHVPPTSGRTHIDVSDLQTILLRNSIDPSLLFPSQVDLFQNADDDQRLRLLELWRISPPQGRQGMPEGLDYNTSRQLYDWPPTSLAQEEAMAKLRYERTVQEREQAEEIWKHQQQLDQSMGVDGDSAGIQARDVPASSPDMPNAEPYIVSGYDMLAKREYEESASSANHLRESTKYNRATDPVYSQSGVNAGLWEKPAASILDMENQYGAFAQARDHDVQPMYADDEMVM